MVSKKRGNYAPSMPVDQNLKLSKVILEKDNWLSSVGDEQITQQQQVNTILIETFWKGTARPTIHTLWTGSFWTCATGPTWTCLLCPWSKRSGKTINFFLSWTTTTNRHIYIGHCTGTYDSWQRFCWSAQITTQRVSTINYLCPRIALHPTSQGTHKYLHVNLQQSIYTDGDRQTNTAG